LPGEVVLGKGLSEQKAPLAAILLALESILERRIALSGRLIFCCCVSGETGRHDAIRNLIEETGVRAEMAILNGNRQQDQSWQPGTGGFNDRGPRQPVP